MSQYTEFVPVRVTEEQKARLGALARKGSRKMSDEIRRLIDEAFERTFPPTPGDAPAIVEALCDVCGAERAFVWRAHWEAEGMVIELYDCPECGATKSLKTLSQLREAKGSAC